MFRTTDALGDYRPDRPVAAQLAAGAPVSYGTYLAWLDCTAMDLPDSPGALVIDRAQVTVVDGPAFGTGGAGAFRFNFATPQPILAEMVERIAAVLNHT